jgi:hypothetical protein
VRLKPHALSGKTAICFFGELGAARMRQGVSFNPWSPNARDHHPGDEDLSWGPRTRGTRSSFCERRERSVTVVALSTLVPYRRFSLLRQVSVGEGSPFGETSDPGGSRKGSTEMRS